MGSLPRTCFDHNALIELLVSSVFDLRSGTDKDQGLCDSCRALGKLQFYH
jgi:hypothetical protein